MLQPDYQTVFEIGIGSFPWTGLLHPVPFIIIGALLLRFSRGKQIYKIAGAIVAAFATFFLLIAAMTFVPEFVKLRRTYRSGDSSLVEGIVENFQPAPVLGALRESFSVHGVVFSYFPGDATPCFHNDPARRGPIRPGLDVRIYYKDGCIQRVDIRGWVAHP
jgi:hypothetical protein